MLTCVFYVASYVSKPEKTLGDLLKAESKPGKHLGAKASMRSVAKKFLSHREVCGCIPSSIITTDSKIETSTIHSK